MATHDAIHWHSLQCFGDRTPAEQVSGTPVQKCDAMHVQADEADIISTMDFDASGDFLATGDKGGRVVIFERVPVHESIPYPNPDSPTSPASKLKQHQPSWEFR